MQALCTPSAEYFSGYSVLIRYLSLLCILLSILIRYPVAPSIAVTSFISRLPTDFNPFSILINYPGVPLRSPFSFFLIPKNNASLIHLRRKVPRPPCHDPFLEPAPLFRRQDRKPGKTLRRLYLPLFRIPHRKSRPPPLRTTAGNAMQNNSSAPWGE